MVMDEERRKNLRLIREGTNWDEVEALEEDLLRQMSVEQSVRAFLRIQATLEYQFRNTESLFRQEREAHLIKVQSRLAKIDKTRQKTMETLVDAVINLQKRLEDANVPSVLIGGLAVSVWGEPRGTHDVDVKVLLRRDEGQKLLDVLGEEYTPLHADALRALRINGIMFVHDQSEIRIDLALRDTDFDESAIKRGQMMELMPTRQARVCSAEDLIVYKLLAPRGRDYDDIVSIIRRQGDALDDRYVMKWLREFEIALDDSNLVKDYQRLRAKKRSKRAG